MSDGISSEKYVASRSKIESARAGEGNGIEDK